MSKPVQSYREMRVYQVAFDTAMEIFELTKIFPKEEKCLCSSNSFRSASALSYSPKTSLFFCLDTKEPKNQGGIKLDAQKTGVSDRNSAKNKQPDQSNGNTPGIVFSKILMLHKYEEKYSLTDQIRRSSRSVCQSIAEAWKKRPYPAHFVSKLTDSDSEASETEVWLDFAYKCGYLSAEDHEKFLDRYDHIGRMLTNMINDPDGWCKNVRRK